MTPIQQMFLGVGGATKTYVDDVYDQVARISDGSTYANSSGLDLSGEGGMVWTKSRSNAFHSAINDSIRGANYILISQTDAASATGWAGANTFTSTGYSIAGGDAINNATGYTYVDWAFRKSEGFFDVVSWTGNGSNPRAINHSLKSVPGCIMVKRTDTSYQWVVYHQRTDIDNPENYVMQLESTAAKADEDWFGDTLPTSTQFTVSGGATNANGATYVAYVFAGGSANSPSLGRSVDFDGTGDDLTIGSSSDWGLGTGDFTWEAWIKPTQAWTSGTWETVFMVGTSPETGGLWIGQNTSNEFVVRAFSDQDLLTYSISPTVGVWTHVAVARSGTTLKLFYNGIEQKSVTTSYDFQTGSNARIANDGHNQRFTGKVSNLRLVKGTAVYTSDFVPSDSLTNITNTVLLCCNNSSITGSTVTPATITSNGDPSADEDSPAFSDAAANIFGADKDQGIIKCGSYTGVGGFDGPEVYLGWEPQWVLLKATETKDGNYGDWMIGDSMRGLAPGFNGDILYANKSDASSSDKFIVPTPRGFKIIQSGIDINESTVNYMYIAIRRPDGYVGKPPESGTNVFAIDYGSGSTTIPTFDSTFPVDFTMLTKSDDTGNRFAPARLIQGTKVNLDQSNAAGTFSYGMFDSNVGSITHEGDGGSTGSTAYIGFQWKRHAGFDVVLDDGTGAAKQIPHSLNAVPEMIWRKSRSNAHGWVVYHKGLNGGTTPQNYWIQLASTDAEAAATNTWNDTAPTSTHFTVGDGQWVSDNGATFITFLFSSVTGISKVGYYTGNASNSGQSITLGFQPRLLFITPSNIGDQKWLFDSTTGFNTAFKLNSNAAPSTAINGMISPTSTGFDLTGTDFNGNSQEFIYYAHA